MVIFHLKPLQPDDNGKKYGPNHARHDIAHFREVGSGDELVSKKH